MLEINGNEIYVTRGDTAVINLVLDNYEFVDGDETKKSLSLKNKIDEFKNISANINVSITQINDTISLLDASIKELYNMINVMTDNLNINKNINQDISNEELVAAMNEQTSSYTYSSNAYKK